MQFFEQPKSITDQYGSEEEFLKSTYVSMQGVVRDLRNWDMLQGFKFFRLDNVNKPVFDSGDLEIQYLSKLTAWVYQDSYVNKVRFMFFTSDKRYTIAIPVMSETVIGKKEDLQDKNKITIDENPNTYHQDHPVELRETTIELNNK